MTKGEYCKSKGLHIYGCNLEEELDEEFKDTVDRLEEAYEEIYNENEDSEV